MINKEDIREITLEDIFTISEIISSIGVTSDDLKGKDEVEMGTTMLFKLLKSTKKIKKDFYSLLSNITGVHVEFVNKLTFKELMIVWEGIKEKNDLTMVFTQAKGMI